ncbi:hypothetical protein K493DRAFT_315402 [Basidiobolus meristosporus CBS 931.73]|uniref:Uncharacterized protein n=1 Tax=Basidiobolus meristosporus CBS 931.73 TaxID=1314790 RepID=A0A1Y1Y9P3_9FUNG|nr:hypothetical protein K493DRAFT_315402 [Basidiobolus meristosporus CBS 931.73]|eukprot:ORX94615.1 hypothetical protein K493DRAFT_315402 [Basidiobolus meristosporus CBS 931.73]
MFCSPSPVPSPAPNRALRGKPSLTSLTSHLRKLARKVTFRNLRVGRRAQESESDGGVNPMHSALMQLKSVQDFDDMIENGFLVDVETGFREPTVRFSITPILARDSSV